MDISQIDFAREIGAVNWADSDSKFRKKVFEFVNRAWREYEEELC